ncbi:hypothetical protein KIN20_018576 [Parelaphostrongylus tenuis]|uniref:Uncharacterized protein n=1 Tax=Parelaphostrongylus tenuis TaxID=148309 RepID=A0AAD5MJL5_PARTN|nr:hypothetical protein KIN20_018576 [Parelaphostrongylus tenuis]
MTALLCMQCLIFNEVGNSSVIAKGLWNRGHSLTSSKIYVGRKNGVKVSSA